MSITQVPILSDGGKEWNRRVSGRGKINLPPEVRAEKYLITAPTAIPNQAPDEIRLYSVDDPPFVYGRVRNEIRECQLYESGQLTIPRQFIEDTPFDIQPCEVTVQQKDDYIKLSDPRTPDDAAE